MNKKEIGNDFINDDINLDTLFGKRAFDNCIKDELEEETPTNPS